LQIFLLLGPSTDISCVSYHIHATRGVEKCRPALWSLRGHGKCLLRQTFILKRGAACGSSSLLLSWDLSTICDLVQSHWNKPWRKCYCPWLLGHTSIFPLKYIWENWV
jgi:hypothetical protein